MLIDWICVFRPCFQDCKERVFVLGVKEGKNGI